MKLRVAAILLTMSSIVYAQPKPPAIRPSPMKPPAPACGPANVESTRIALVGNDTVVCWKEFEKPETCAALAATGGPRKAPPPPVTAPAARTAEIRDAGGKLSACAGDKCVPVGKKLAAAIAKHAADQAKEKAEQGANYVQWDKSPYVSKDLKLATVGADAWNIKSDKKLKLSPPSEYKKSSPDKPTLSSVEIVGNLGIAFWTDCAGPCGYSVVFDANGKNKGKRFAAGEAIPLDDKRLAVVSGEVDSGMTIIDIKSAKQLAKLEFGGGALEGGLGSVKVDNNTLAVAWRSSEPDEWTVGTIAVAPGAKPTMTKRSIPVCPQ